MKQIKKKDNQKVLVLNHHGLGDLLMSLPAIRLLVSNYEGLVFMTVVGELEKKICLGQRCGEHIIPFEMKNRIEVIKKIIDFRQSKIDFVIATYGFKPIKVFLFSKLSRFINCLHELSSQYLIGDRLKFQNVNVAFSISQIRGFLDFFENTLVLLLFEC